MNYFSFNESDDYDEVINYRYILQKYLSKYLIPKIINAIKIMI